MLIAPIAPRWIAVFEEMLALAHPRAGESAAILSESKSRPVLVVLAEHAVAAHGLDWFHVRVPSPLAPPGAPLRSTGTSLAIGGKRAIIDALAGADLIIDVTVEGLLHSAERAALGERGARIFMIGNESPEVFERLRPMPGLNDACVRGAQMLTNAREMRVTSRFGTDLKVKLGNVPGRGSAGEVSKPGGFGYWPAGLCLAFPAPGSVEGRLVFRPGDANLTFKRYFETPVTLTIEEDHVTAIEGDGLDAELMRSYYAAFPEDGRDAYAVSHVGWGMNPAARWDVLTMYDKGDVNGIELRAFAGNFLFSTGANETAGRFTACHFDLPMRNCTVQLDGDEPVVNEGVLRQDLRIAV